MAPTEHFKNAGDYRRWNAFRHINGIPAPHLETAVVAGKPHKVQHTELSKPKRNSMYRSVYAGRKKGAK
jgi:hypothetical protein